MLTNQNKELHLYKSNEKKEIKMENTEKIYKELKAIDLIMTPTYFDTLEKYENSQKYDYVDFCSCCGRGIKGQPKFGLLTLGGPMPIPVDSDLNAANYYGVEIQGWFPIGSECKKLYPKEYIGKWQF